MKIAMSALCDRATTRDNLLHVLGAGITQIGLGAVPGLMDVDLAILVRLETIEDMSGQHNVLVRVVSPGKNSIVEASFIWELATPDDLSVANLPLPHVPVAVPLHQVTLPEVGKYEVQVDLDGVRVDTLALSVHLDTSALAMEGSGSQ